jgi:hypothetical protein
VSSIRPANHHRLQAKALVSHATEYSGGTGSGSIAITSAPSAASTAVSFPVPAPRSSTRGPGAGSSVPSAPRAARSPGGARRMRSPLRRTTIGAVRPVPRGYPNGATTGAPPLDCGAGRAEPSRPRRIGADTTGRAVHVLTSRAPEQVQSVLVHRTMQSGLAGPNQLAALARREEVLAAIQEAVTIRWELAARWPDSCQQRRLEHGLQVAAGRLAVPARLASC